MANRTAYPAQTLGSARVYYEFELLGNATGNPTLSTDAAYAVASCVRTGVGIYVITLKDAFTRLVAKTADPDDTLNDGSYATLSNVTNEGTNLPLTCTLRFRSSSGTAADAAVGRRIGITLALRNGGWGMT